jgi:hypothetical protein
VGALVGRGDARTDEQALHVLGHEHLSWTGKIAHTLGDADRQADHVVGTTGVAANPGLPPVYVETSWWPLEMASQSPSTEQLVNVMHTYAKGDAIDFDDEEGAESWLLWAKSATACGADLTVSCVLSHAAATKNWDAGGIQAPVAQLSMSNENPQPSACFALLKAEPHKFVYDKAITQPTQSIWNCNPKNVVHLTPQEQQQLASL